MGALQESTMRIHPFAIARIVSFGLVASACDPHNDVTGTVRDQHGRPISNVQATMKCPHDWNHGTTTTDASGQFQLSVGPGCLDRSCVVLIQLPTGPARSYTVADHCYKSHLACPAECNGVKIDAVF